MRSFEQRLSDFNARGIRIVAISVDPSAVTKHHAEKQGYTYTFLSDAQREVIHRYDLVHAGGGPNGSDIARPAEFLLDSTGTVRWVNLTEDFRVRARPDQVMRGADASGL